MIKETKPTKNNMNAKYKALVKPMPDLDEFVVIDKHPFSCNYHFEWKESVKDYRRTVAYNAWLYNITTKLSPAIFPDIDWEKPIEVTLLGSVILVNA